MATSANSSTRHLEATSANSSTRPEPWNRYTNKKYFCSKNSKILVSDTIPNLNLLYYACKLNICKFYKRCEPMKEDSSVEISLDDYFDSRFGKIEEDVNNMIMIYAAEMEDMRGVIRETYVLMTNDFDVTVVEVKKLFENEVSEMKKGLETETTSLRNDLKLVEDTLKMEMEKNGQTVRMLNLLTITMVLVWGCMLFNKLT